MRASEDEALHPHIVQRKPRRQNAADEVHAAARERDDKLTPVREPLRSARVQHRAKRAETQPLDGHVECPQRQKMPALVQRGGQQN